MCAVAAAAAGPSPPAFPSWAPRRGRPDQAKMGRQAGKQAGPHARPDWAGTPSGQAEQVPHARLTRSLSLSYLNTPGCCTGGGGQGSRKGGGDGQISGEGSAGGSGEMCGWELSESHSIREDEMGGGGKEEQRWRCDVAARAGSSGEDRAEASSDARCKRSFPGCISEHSHMLATSACSSPSFSAPAHPLPFNCAPSHLP